MTNLLPYQIPHVENLVASIQRFGAALDASDAGTGKTYCALAAAKALDLNVFVLCPKVVIPMWKRVSTHMEVKHGILNYDMARRHGIKKYRNTLYVFDEVHMCSGLETLNAELLVNVKKLGLPVLMLSATVAETPMKLWAIGYCLGLHNGIINSSKEAANPFVAFGGRNFFAWTWHMGVRPIPNLGIRAFSNSPKDLKRLHGVIFPTRGSRMKKRDIADFPEVQNTVETVKAEDHSHLKPFFDDIRLRRINLLEQLDLDPDQEAPLGGLQNDPSLVLDVYERMETELYKVVPLLELARNAVEEGNSVVIFVNFRGTLHALRSMQPNSVSVYGGQDPEDRQYSIDLFQGDADGARILLATTESGGTSISLHDLHGTRPRMSLISPGWRAVSLIQALGRIHRAGAKSKAWNRLILVENSIEGRVAKRLSKKIQAIETINDGDLYHDSDLSFMHIESKQSI